MRTQISNAWQDAAYRDLCHRTAQKAQEQEPSDPFVYVRTIAHLKSGVLEVSEVYIREQHK